MSIDIKLYIKQIDRRWANRRDAERDAVRSLVEAAFGEDSEYTHLADGSPCIVGRSEHISVSHDATTALLSVSDCRIGVDVECWREQLQRVKSKYLTDDELERYTSQEQLLKAWTAKEATFKAAGIEGATITCASLPTLSNAIFSHQSMSEPETFRVDYLGEFPQMIALAYPTQNINPTITVIEIA